MQRAMVWHTHAYIREKFEAGDHFFEHILEVAPIKFTSRAFFSHASDRMKPAVALYQP